MIKEASDPFNNTDNNEILDRIMQEVPPNQTKNIVNEVRYFLESFQGNNPSKR